MTETMLQFIPLALVNLIISVSFFGVAKRKSQRPALWIAGLLLVPILNWLILVPLLVSKTDLTVLKRLNALESKAR